MKAVREEAPAREHEFEPERGLPEPLPGDEQVLWQGSPAWRPLARRAFHVRKVAVYFVLLAVLRVGFLAADGASAGTMALSGLLMLLLGATAVGLLVLMAWLSARTAVYTITDRRVVMRIGIVLTLTFNLPFKRIAAAGLRVESDGSGEIPITLRGDDRIAWLHLWPHVRPWRLSKPDPMLRSVPDAERVARLLTEAWSRSTGQTAVPAAAEAPAAPAGTRQPALAGR